MTLRSPFRLLWTVLGLLIVAAVTACDSESTAPDPFYVRIESGAATEPVKLIGQEGESITITDKYIDELTITVVKIDGDQVTISTSAPMAPEGASGGINLNDPRAKFTLAKGEPVRFSTPTMDGGTTYTATYEAISVE